MISFSFAQLNQLISRDFRGDQAEAFKPNQSFSQAFIRFDQTACASLDQAREDFADHIGTDRYREIFEHILSPLIEKCFVKAFVSEDEVVAFQMINHKKTLLIPRLIIIKAQDNIYSALKEDREETYNFRFLMMSPLLTELAMTLWSQPLSLSQDATSLQLISSIL